MIDRPFPPAEENGCGVAEEVSWLGLVERWHLPGRHRPVAPRPAAGGPPSISPSQLRGQRRTGRVTAATPDFPDLSGATLAEGSGFGQGSRGYAQGNRVKEVRDNLAKC